MAVSAPFQTNPCWLSFAGTSILGADAAAVAAIDAQISASSSYVADLSTITDGPAGLNGPGSVASWEIPAGSGWYFREIRQFSDNSLHTNRWAAGAWGGWQGGAAGFTVTQYATTGDLPDPTTVPTGAMAYVPTDPVVADRGLYMAEGVLNAASAQAWRQQ